MGSTNTGATTALTRRRQALLRWTLMAGAGWLGYGATASAADNNGGALEEIIVTATRREESASKVPISITAMSQEAMDQRGVKDFSDVARFTPGVVINSGGGSTNAIAIRGISSSGGSGTTGIYIDDTPIQIRAIGFNPDDTLPKTFDLDRVEVLRGPQGTLFGAGSEGGTVRYILTQPSLSKSSTYVRSEVSTTAGGEPSYEAGVAHGSPIIDGKLGYRASVWYRRDGGWIDRVDPFTLATVDKNANHADTLMMRLAGIWQPTEALTITPSVIYQNRQIHNVDGYWPGLSDPDSNRFISANPDSRSVPDKYYLPVVKLTWDLGKAQLISNTSYYHRDEQTGYQGTLYNLGYFQTFNWPGSLPNSDDALPFLNPSYYPLIDANGLHLPASLHNYRSPATVTNKQENWTQEVRLQSTDPTSRWTWTLGAFWSMNRVESVEEIHDPMIETFFQTMFGVSPFDPAVFGSPLLANGDDYYNRNVGFDRQLAGFGELSYNITPSLKATAGARLSRTSFSFTHFADGTQNGGPDPGGGHSSETPFTPKLGLSWQIDESNMVYTTYAKGFRIGGANPPLPPGCGADLAKLGLTDEPASYDSDTVQSYEIGSKNKISNRIKLAASLYYIKWNAIQQNVYLPGCGLQFTGNFGRAVSKGFDLQADFVLGGGFSLETAIGHTTARFVQNSPGDLVVEGDAVTGNAGTAPPWTAAVGAQYDFTIASRQAYLRLDWEYEQRSRLLTATQDTQAAQYNPYSFTTPTTRFVSLRAGINLEAWAVSVFVDNLFDSHTLTGYGQSDVDYVNPNPNGPPAPLAYDYTTFRPRTIGINLTYRN